jgi:hypothetical protein
VIWLLSSFWFFTISANAALPEWVTNTSTEDSEYHYVVCSHDGLDPEYTKQLAENKCLSSAAKLGGVTLSIKQKTIDSASGVDSSEEATVTPFTQNTKCEFTKRFLQEISQGFRVWLLCRVKKSETSLLKRLDKTEPKEPELSVSITKYKKATIIITSVPPAEKIIVDGDRGARVIDVKKNPYLIELREGDKKITVKKHKYRDGEIVLDSEWENGSTMSKTLILDQEI